MKNINLIRDRKGHSHLLKYPVSCQDIIKYQLEIINDEEQLNFLKINYEEDEFLSVDITSLIPLNIYFQNYCDVYKRIKLLFVTLIEVLEECEHFLLDLDCIVIDEKSCFYNIEMNRVSLIYIPVKEIRSISIHERVKNMFLGMIFLNIDMEYIKSVNKGIEEAMATGEVAGYPVVDVKATLLDGSYHDVDSSEMAFRIAASKAFRDAMKKTNPILLEPIMKVEVVVPEKYMGEVIGDLNSRRGKVSSVDLRNKNRIIKVEVPLSEMFGYATDVRSKTQGRAIFSMEFEKYEPIPGRIADEIINRYKGNSIAV